ncbi:hypothetical protein [Aliiroseovarius subalbicans]|uniref:hypothetical protein n=1 Tax=Aliiroseovarius subalbicans TaxID=2925840 RepID=UPI001F5ACF4A|nr:hypothetical protein [Aliiroseovarius subalbicans]MCI2399628.1 hypothetical protein [Aliiroseovarius subalbicans]
MPPVVRACVEELAGAEHLVSASPILAAMRVTRRGEPVFLCFCGMTNFHRFKLGFDRTF